MKVKTTHVAHSCQDDSLTLSISVSLTDLEVSLKQLDQILSWPLVEQHLGRSLAEGVLVALEVLQLTRLRELLGEAEGAGTAGAGAGAIPPGSPKNKKS